MNTCGSCGVTFGSIKAFNAHRIGKLAYDYSEAHPDGRRCLAKDELEAAGFARNARGDWSLARDLHRARALRMAEPRSSDTT